MKKFKHWLIKKLGGYIVEPQKEYKELVFQSVTKKPINISAKVFAPYNVSVNNEELSHKLIDGIAEEIYKNELYYNIYICDNPLERIKEFRLELDILPRV